MFYICGCGKEWERSVNNFKYCPKCGRKVEVE